MLLEFSDEPQYKLLNLLGFYNAVNPQKDGFSLGNVRIGEVLINVMNLCRTHCVLIDDTMAQLVSSIALLDGIGRQLDPTRDLFDTAKPVLLRLFDLHSDYRDAIISSGFSGLK